ncbi:MAG: pseudouridine synthase [Bacteroidales bacterium]|nr:pseudouridine synthase [Bacteroidales bacterium]
MFHLFSSDISSIQLPDKFTCPFCYTPHPLCSEAKEDVCSYLNENEALLLAAEEGKMFGVLIVENERKQIGFLAAFSGQLAGKNFHKYFVPPVFDILEDKKFYIDEDEEISSINRKIKEIESSTEYKQAIQLVQESKKDKEATLRKLKEEMHVAKQQRDEKRKSYLTDEDKQQLIRESQFQKAEYKRIEQSLNEIVSKNESVLNDFQQNIESLKTERKRLSAKLQEKLFSCFIFYNANKDQKSLFAIFKDYKKAIPPSGAGECAAPRLLQYAYTNNYKPIAMAEFWYGKSPKQEIKEHGNFYPACKHKCEPILDFMLQGLNVEENRLQKENLKISVIYEDEAILVINKPSGMLSVPGKSSQKSAYEYAKELNNSELFTVHRLDMDTSGILLFAKTQIAQSNLQKQFSNKETQKKYVAIVEGKPKQKNGTITLPLIPDIENRPYQVVDYEHGKQTETEYVILKESEGQTRIQFIPKTGRTHQLRVHAAHKQGLGCPIVGDNLYGKPADRLYLHAEQLQCIHPQTGEIMTFNCKAPF